MRRDSKATIDYEYKGTLFQLTEEEHWRGPSTYLITDIKKHSEEIEFPAQANYKQIEKLALSDNSWYGRENKKEYIYPGVKKIIIPQNLGIDCLENKTFPDLEEIVLPPKEEESEGETVKKTIYIFPPEWAGTFGQPITSVAQIGILQQEHYAGN